MNALPNAGSFSDTLILYGTITEKLATYSLSPSEESTYEASVLTTSPFTVQFTNIYPSAGTATSLRGSVSFSTSVTPASPIYALPISELFTDTDIVLSSTINDLYTSNSRKTIHDIPSSIMYIRTYLAV